MDGVFMSRTMTRRNFALLGTAATAALGLGGTAQAAAWAKDNRQPGGRGSGSRGHGARSQAASGMLSDEFLDRLPELMEFAGVPGVAIAIVDEGQVAWTREFGVRNAETGPPVDGSTIFQAASLGKPLFAYAVLRMHEDKLIDIDRPLHEYLPLPDLDADPRSRRITGRHVLSHTTGLPNWRRSAQQKLAIFFDPGERFGYSGEAFYHLQRIVEKLTGQGIDEVMRERVFDPLGMDASSYFWLPEHASRISSRHDFGGTPSEAWSAQLGPKMLELATKANQPLSSWKHEDVVQAFAQIAPTTPGVPNFLIPNVAGSLLTTAGEYALFLKRLLGDRAGGEFAISEDTRHRMLSPQVRINSALAYGLGWALESTGGRDYFWQWGDNGGFKAFTINEPARGWGIVILTNSAGGMRLSNLIVREATGHDHPAFLWEMVS